MEATQKTGFFKGKLAKPFSRVKKPTPHQQYGSTGGCSKVVPTCSPSNSNSGAFTGQNMANCSSIPRVSTNSYAKQPITSFHEQKNYVANIPSTMQKVSYASFKPPSFDDQNSFANDTWGQGDENVDFKATSFISGVRERFEHDIDSTGNKYQEMLQGTKVR